MTESAVPRRIDAARRRVPSRSARRSAAGATAAADVADHVRRSIALPPAAVVRIEASMATVRLNGTARDDVGLEVDAFSAPSRPTI